MSNHPKTHIYGWTVKLSDNYQLYYGEFKEDGTIYKWEGTEIDDIDPKDVLLPDSLIAYHVAKDYMDEWYVTGPISEEIESYGIPYTIWVEPTYEKHTF